MQGFEDDTSLEADGVEPSVAGKVYDDFAKDLGSGLVVADELLAARVVD